jgi:hypothetical protein
LFALMQLSLSLSLFRTAFVQIGIKLEESRVLFFLLSRAGTFPAVAFDQMYCARDRFGCKQKQRAAVTARLMNEGSLYFSAAVPATTVTAAAD